MGFWVVLCILPRRIDSAIAGPEEAKNPAGERCPRSDSDLSNGIKFGKNLANLPKQFAANVDYRFEFQKCRQLFIRAHNKTLSAVAMRVSNSDRLSFRINSWDTPPAPLQPFLLRFSPHIS